MKSKRFKRNVRTFLAKKWPEIQKSFVLNRLDFMMNIPENQHSFFFGETAPENVGKT